jgi:hypothetical protein
MKEKHVPASRAISCGSGGTMPSASPSMASLGLPKLPLDVASGDCSPRIAPADAMVIDFGVQNRVVALWKSLFEASVQKARNGPSTQLIKATSCVERLNTTIKAKEHS